MQFTHAGRKLSRSVVARIQRFSSGGLLRRSVLQSIAAELLASHPELQTSATPGGLGEGQGVGKARGVWFSDTLVTE